MLETTPTHGSIETTTPQKVQFAARSMEFNLKNATFVDLFPDLIASYTPPPSPPPLSPRLSSSRPSSPGERGEGTAWKLALLGLAGAAASYAVLR